MSGKQQTLLELLPSCKGEAKGVINF